MGGGTTNTSPADNASYPLHPSGLDYPLAESRSIVYPVTAAFPLTVPLVVCHRSTSEPYNQELCVHLVTRLPLAESRSIVYPVTAAFPLTVPLVVCRRSTSEPRAVCSSGNETTLGRVTFYCVPSHSSFPSHCLSSSTIQLRAVRSSGNEPTIKGVVVCIMHLIMNKKRRGINKLQYNYTKCISS